MTGKESSKPDWMTLPNSPEGETQHLPSWMTEPLPVEPLHDPPSQDPWESESKTHTPPAFVEQNPDDPTGTNTTASYFPAWLGGQSTFAVGDGSQALLDSETQDEVGNRCR